MPVLNEPVGFDLSAVSYGIWDENYKRNEANYGMRSEIKYAFQLFFTDLSRGGKWVVEPLSYSFYINNTEAGHGTNPNYKYYSEYDPAGVKNFSPAQEKAMDVPTNIYAHTKFNKFLFSGWDRASWPLLTNLKITTASPDTRSKLITEGRLTTYGITFDVNKADIKPESRGTLNDIATVLKENPAVRVKIIGHTDSDGDDALNLDLSRRRAESVKNELASKFGIDATRIEADGAGESKPVAPNDTPVNKAMNRRVEFIKL